MKKVIMNVEPTIELYRIDNSHLIGVEFESGHRGQLVKVDSGIYVIYSISYNTHCFLTTGTSIRDLLHKLEDKKDVYVFDSTRELGEWLVESLK